MNIITIDDKILEEYFPDYTNKRDRRLIRAGLFNLMIERAGGARVTLQNKTFGDTVPLETKGKKVELLKNLVMNFLEETPMWNYTCEEIADGIRQDYEKIGFTYPIERQLPHLIANFHKNGHIEKYKNGYYGALNKKLMLKA